MYLPKDIVAGDFYWLERSGDVVFFAVADCTGHGVPGALVSVVAGRNSSTPSVRQFPRFAILHSDQFVRLAVVRGLLLHRVPSEFGAGAIGEISQVRHAGNVVADLDVQFVSNPTECVGVIGQANGPTL